MTDLTQSLPIHSDPLVTKEQSDAEHARSEERSGRMPVVPGYAILDALGEGGMGIVYKATQLKLNRTVAVKMIHGGRAAGTKEIIRFLAEAEAVAAIDHPHVVKVFDTGDAGGHPYLAMEYLPGGSLSEKLKASGGCQPPGSVSSQNQNRGADTPRSPLPPSDAINLIRKLALAVQAAHDCQIVHRDLKPSNIMFDANNEPRILDFGLAKRDGGGIMTQTNAIMGTAAYMAPEQARGENKFVGPPADVWALGVILYECLTGARPFTGSHDLEVIRKVVDAQPSSLRSRIATIPKDLELIVEKCLAKDPTGRYPSAAALAEDLRRWLAGEPVSVKAAGPIERGAKWVKRNKLAAGIMLASGLGTAVATTLAIIAWRESQRADLAVQEATNESILAHYEAARAEAEVKAAVAANAELLVISDERQFAISFPKIGAKHGHAMLGPLDDIIDAKLPGDAKDEEKERLAKQQANAAVALLRLNKPEKVWPLFKHSPDPRLRSYLIHRIAPYGVDPKLIIARLAIEPEISIRRALILSIGEFDEAQLPLNERMALIPKLQETYRSDTDPGLHSAIEWLLRAWKQEQWIQHVNEEWAKTGRAASDTGVIGPRWQVNSQGQTMIVIPGPVEFLMGSPDWKTFHYGRDEQQQKRRIGRTFAIAAKPVTVEQYCKFNENYKPSILHSGGRSNQSPADNISWHQAAAYCNWLSEREGIPRDQWCYELNAKGEVTKMNPKYLSLKGYRLPTDAEWEYAARAESRTSRYYGETVDLLSKYAWYQRNSLHWVQPVSLLKPNDFGYFDLLGNSCNWCQNRFTYGVLETGQDKAIEDSEEVLTVIKTEPRTIRGGGFVVETDRLRSSHRTDLMPGIVDTSIGVRPARTIKS